MVYTRINERASKPNPYINFISTLDHDEDALELLRAIAAQVKPIMKEHGFAVNSFEEYETNKVFLGRNWNNGETIELVLRDGSGRFYATSRLLSVFCHELAHIKHMNHSAAFHELRRKLCTEVSALQLKGYFGDGYWSAGSRLRDSQQIQGDSWSSQELPEYTCGGAYNQSRRSVLPSRKRRRKKAGPSNTTGAQNAKRRKAGSRVISKAAFEAAGSGNVLDETIMKGGEGSGFGKKAASRRAREERALAAERRLMQSQGETPPPETSTSADAKKSSDEEDEDEDDSGYERIDLESDRERLDRMRMSGEDLDKLKDDEDDTFISATDGTSTHPDSAAPMTNIHEQSSYKRGKELSRPLFEDSSEDERYPSIGPRYYQPKNAVASGSKPTKSKTPFGGILKDEIRQRKRDAVGLDRTYKLDSQTKAVQESIPPRQRVLETEPNETTVTGEWSCSLCTFVNLPESRACTMCETLQPSNMRTDGKWFCEMCTFDNKAGADRCEMCGHDHSPS